MKNLVITNFFHILYEYSQEHKLFIKKNFKYAFGQHSGIIDISKDKYELPRFPINEKYGELKKIFVNN